MGDADLSADRYKNREKLPPISTLSGWGERSASKLLDAIVARREAPIPLGNVIAAFNIRMVGKVQAVQIAAACKTIEAFWHAVDNLDEETELRASLGPMGLWQLEVFAGSSEERVLARSIAERLTIQTPEGPASAEAREAGEEQMKGEPRALEGKIVVFSGTFKRTGWTRLQCKAIAKKHGARTPASLSASTDVFVAGTAPGKKKLDMASRHGVSVISEEEFLALVGWESESVDQEAE
eukprot:scaffold7577_cov248-Pinguiococcus_pyrenoidosus.AAC.1